MSKKYTKVKYFITTYLSDSIIVNKVQVSKKVFTKQYNDVMEQYNNQVKPSEFEVEKNLWHQDYGNYTGETTQFTYSICGLYFTVLTCKDGYCFTD